VPPHDRRRAERVRPGPLRVRLHRTCEGTVLDISELGAFVQLPTAQKTEKQIVLYLEWKYETVQLRALVVRSIPHRVVLRNAVLARTEYLVALEFRDLPQDAAAALRRIIQSS